MSTPSYVELSKNLLYGELKSRLGITPKIDPSIFQGRTSEESNYLQVHKDILTLSPQETLGSKYQTIKGVYISLPSIVRLMINMLAIIIVIVIVPLLVLALIRSFQDRCLELTSLAILATILIWLWRSWVQDL
jgi:hypothetical protein